MFPNEKQIHETQQLFLSLRQKKKQDALKRNAS